MTLPLEINQPEAWTDDKLIHRRCSDLLHGFRRSRDSGFPRRLPTSRASPAYDLTTACHTYTYIHEYNHSRIRCCTSFDLPISASIDRRRLISTKLRKLVPPSSLVGWSRRSIFELSYFNKFARSTDHSLRARLAKRSTPIDHHYSPVFAKFVSRIP